MAKDGTNRGGARPGAGRKKKNPDGIMENPAFTAEELKTLVSSPYVAYVSSSSISFTKAFKEAAWRRYCDGAEPHEIFADAGFDLKLIGNNRIRMFFKNLRESKEKGIPFIDGPQPSTDGFVKQFSIPDPPKRAKKTQAPLMTDEEIQNLATKVAYMAQELEFIKKIILAETKEN